MFERTSARTLPVIGRAADLAPAAQACCGVCRTCVTTNVFSLATAAVSGAAYAVARRLKRTA